MRLFIAVDLDEAARRAAAALADEVARRLQSARAAEADAVSWVAHHNLHLTLRFLGEVEPARADRVADGLAGSWPIAAFDLELARLGMFPPAGPPRVIWIGIGRGADALVALEHEIQRRVGPLGFDPDPRPFHPHLTLGRVRKPVRPRARDLVCRDIAAGPIGPSRVTEVSLYQSELSPRGPTYTLLANGVLPAGVELSKESGR